MSDTDWERVPYAEHPDRCQANRGSQGQCWNKRLGVSNFCKAHGGNRANEEAARKEKANYQANAYLQKAKEFGDSSNLVNLDQEVALLKALVEAKQKKIVDDLSFAQHGPQLADLLMKAEKLVTSCNRLNERAGAVLSTQQLCIFAAEIIEIVDEEIEDKDVVERIQQRLVASMDKAETEGKLRSLRTPKSETR